MTQNDQVLDRLQRRPLTPLEALAEFGCLRLAARIKDLRNMGHSINTRIVRNGKKRWAEYSRGSV